MKIVLSNHICRSDKLSPGAYLARPNRPPPSDEVRTYRRPRYRTFPEEVDRIPLVKADCSIPPLSDVPGPEVKSVLFLLSDLISHPYCCGTE